MLTDKNNDDGDIDDSNDDYVMIIMMIIGMIMMSDNDSDHSGSRVSRLRAGQQDHGGRRQGPSAGGRAKVEHRKYFIVKRENISVTKHKIIAGTVCWECPGWSGGFTCLLLLLTTSVMTSEA